MKDVIVKVCITGEGGTGKSTMIQRLISGKYYYNLKMTIGSDIMTHKIEVGSSYRVIFQLWDFAGEKRFRFFLPSYLRGAAAVLLCFDITRFITFKNLDEWYEIVINNTENPIIYLIGTKKDLEDNRAVFPETVEEWIKKTGPKKIDRYFECSSVTGENIDGKGIFYTLAQDLVERRFHNS